MIVEGRLPRFRVSTKEFPVTTEKEFPWPRLLLQRLRARENIEWGRRSMGFAVSSRLTENLTVETGSPEPPSTTIPSRSYPETSFADCSGDTVDALAIEGFGSGSIRFPFWSKDPKP